MNRLTTITLAALLLAPLAALQAADARMPNIMLGIARSVPR